MDKPKTRRRRPKKKTQKNPRWYKMVSFFDGDSKSVLKINDADVVLSGWVPPDMDCAVCLLPRSASHEQGLALQKILEAQFRKPVLVLTNNTQLVRLKQITDREADRFMEGSNGAEVIQIEAGADGAGSREGLRAENRQPDEGDLRSTAAGNGDGGGVDAGGSITAQAPPEDERSSAE